jgi:large subunit ribosomal protein L1
MRKRSKRYKAAAAMVTANKLYTLQEAAELLKKLPAPKFNQGITLSFNLGVDPRKSDQMVRGTCALPHGVGKEVRVLVFAQGKAADSARAAGAEFVGYEDMIAKIKEGWLDFDTAIATPEAMTEVRKLGKQLGPRGLMPNPRTGTVVEDPATAIREVKAGRAEFKLDKTGCCASGIGKLGFEAKQIAENAAALVDAVSRARPATAKGTFILTATLAASMSPGLRIDVAQNIKA